MKLPRSHIIVHHTAAEEQGAWQVRQNHLRRGWVDVGYNYIIEKDGRVVEGRSLDIPGAHTRAAGMNMRGIGVALIGNLENHLPTRQQVEILKQLLSQLQKAHGIERQNILAHRDVPGARTLCPGRYFPYEILERNRERPPVRWRVQVGSFINYHNACKYALLLRSQGIDAFVIVEKAGPN